MKLKTYFNAALLCLAAGLFAACADDIMGDGNKDKQAKEEVKGVKFTTNEPKTRAMSRALVDDDGNVVEQTATRTLIKHTPGLGADAYWDANDYIFVKNKYNQWKKSIAISLFDDGRSAEFTLPGAPDDYAEGCEVRYTITPSLLVDEADAAIIPFNQTQSAPNDFSHAGRVGDSGIGTAHDKGNGMFKFELQHLPHYLCFLPRCENASLVNNIRLTKIRLDNDNSDGTTEVVGATYLLDQDPFNSIGIDTRYNAIELQSTDGNGFPIAATTANAAANACYMAILPGEHDLILTYTIKDPTTNVETEITKRVSGTFKSGEITDITSNLTLPSQAYTNIQPTSGVPNAEEAAWYAELGDAHMVTLPASVVELNGHLENIAVKGIWLKKRAAIIRDNPALFVTDAAHNNFSSAYHGVMFSEWSWLPLPDPLVPGWDGIYSIKEGVPANLSDYFFLPALGGRAGLGAVYGYGTIGAYWTSSKHYNPDDYGSYTVPTPFCLYFDCTTKKIYLKDDVAYYAMVKKAFE